VGGDPVGAGVLALAGAVRRAPVHPAWGLAEIAVLGALFAFTLWVAGPHVVDGGAALAVYWAAVAVTTVTVLWLSPIVLHQDPPSLRGWGWGRRPDDPGVGRNAWPSYLAFTVAASAALLTATAIRDPGFVAHTPWPRVGAKFLIYLVYGGVQAMVFFGYLQTRLRTALGAFITRDRALRPLVALATAGLFAAAHAPNWPLASLVLAAGLGWSWLFFARPNLLLMGISHAVLGTLVYSVLGLFTRIGPFYAHPAGHIARYAIPGLHALVGDLF
jgi:membrane protease YdiL (CAAX protease family)